MQARTSHWGAELFVSHKIPISSKNLPSSGELTGAVLDSNANTRSAPTQRAKWLL
jgi:hypothetical protein